MEADPGQQLMYETLLRFSDDELLRKTKELAREERRLTVEVLYHLREVERRSLFNSIGFDSLQTYAIRELGYSETSANRRIQAMRLLDEIPEMAAKITEGQMNLTSAAKVQSFLRAEAKGNKTYSRNEKLELIEALERRPTREVNRELRRQAGFADGSRGSGRSDDASGERNGSRSESRSRMTIEESSNGEFALKLPRALHEKLDRLLLAKSVRNPNLGYLEVLEQLIDEALTTIEPSPSAAAISKVIDETITQTRKRSRTLSVAMQKQVWQSCGHLGCTYVDANTGRRCGSKANLEIDHIVPFAMGGRNELSNLRLVCSQHNRWRGDADEASSSPDHIRV